MLLASHLARSISFTVGGLLFIGVAVVMLLHRERFPALLKKYSFGFGWFEDRTIVKMVKLYAIAQIVFACFFVLLTWLVGESPAGDERGSITSTQIVIPVSPTTEQVSTPTTQSEAGDEFVFTGTGSATIELPGGHDRVVVRATYDGSGEFVVRVVVADGIFVDEKGVVGANAGPYEGTGLIPVPLADVTGLEVTASGEWSIEMLPADAMPRVGDEFSGNGDDVMWYDGPGGVAAITRAGDGPFVIEAVDGRFLLPVVVGDFEGTEQWPAGPILFGVHGSGEWRVRIEPGESPAGNTLAPGAELSAQLAVSAEACLAHLVELQRLGRTGSIKEAEWRPIAQALYADCQTATEELRPLALRSPDGSPVRVLRDVLFQVGVLVGAADREVVGPCDDPCVLAPGVAATLVQFGPDYTTVPRVAPRLPRRQPGRLVPVAHSRPRGDSLTGVRLTRLIQRRPSASRTFGSSRARCQKCGLTYLNNRYHDPQLATFTSVDPLVSKTGTPYLYASGSPVTRSDPSGLDDGFNLIAAIAGAQEAGAVGTGNCYWCVPVSGDITPNSFAVTYSAYPET